MFYEYRCLKCGWMYETQSFSRIGESLPERTCQCGNDLTRIVSVFNATPVSTLQPHFNHTVGSWVTGTRDFEHKLKEGQRRMSERLGYDQSFTPVMPGEAKHYNESTASNDKENGESVERYRRERNQIDTTKTIIT